MREERMKRLMDVKCEFETLECALITLLAPTLNTTCGEAELLAKDIIEVVDYYNQMKSEKSSVDPQQNQRIILQAMSLLCEVALKSGQQSNIYKGEQKQ